MTIKVGAHLLDPALIKRVTYYRKKDIALVEWNGDGRSTSFSCTTVQFQEIAKAFDKESPWEFSSSIAAEPDTVTLLPSRFPSRWVAEVEAQERIFEQALKSEDLMIEV